MALGAQNEQTASGQGFGATVSNVGLDHGDLSLFHFGRDFDAHAALFLTPAGDAHLGIAAELNIGAAASHVGGDGHRAGRTGIGHDHGLLLVIARIQHIVRDAGPGLALMLELVSLEDLGQGLGLFDGDRTDQNRLAACETVFDLDQNGGVLLALGAIDLVVNIDTHDGAVGRDLGHVHLVDVVEFRGLGRGGAGHARQLGIETEIVLDGHRGEGLVLGLDVRPFLGLNGLVQTFGQAPSAHHPASELIDQDDLAALDDIVLVALIELVGAQGLIDVVHRRDVGGIIETG